MLACSTLRVTVHAVLVGGNVTGVATLSESRSLAEGAAVHFGRPLMGSSDPGSMPTELFGDEGDGNFNQVAVKTIQFRYQCGAQSGVQAQGSGPRLMACRTQSLGHEPHQALPPAWAGLGLFRAWPGWAWGLSLSLAHH